MAQQVADWGAFLTELEDNKKCNKCGAPGTWLCAKCEQAETDAQNVHIDKRIADLKDPDSESSRAQERFRGVWESSGVSLSDDAS